MYATNRKEVDLLLGMTPLMLATLDGNEDLVQLLLDKGANVNAKTPSGDTALSIAKELDSGHHRSVIHKLGGVGAKK